RWRGVRTLLGVGPQLNAARDARPDGLLAEERMLYSLRHVGFRQYWRDLDALERFTRSEPHRTWWARFVRDAGGTGIWH
ncbi:DUF4188 domain-containing protein, partial [Acinetobacter baumannii]|nr:DUF4188 domain-containing protein [Acinetobacter baumannii]